MSEYLNCYKDERYEPRNNNCWSFVKKFLYDQYNIPVPDSREASLTGEGYVTYEIKKGIICVMRFKLNKQTHAGVFVDKNNVISLGKMGTILTPLTQIQQTCDKIRCYDPFKYYMDLSNDV